MGFKNKPLLSQVTIYIRATFTISNSKTWSTHYYHLTLSSTFVSTVCNMFFSCCDAQFWYRILSKPFLLINFIYFFSPNCTNFDIFNLFHNRWLDVIVSSLSTCYYSFVKRKALLVSKKNEVGLEGTDFFSIFPLLQLWKSWF